MISVLKKIYICITIFISFLGLLTIDTVIENMMVSSQIKDFMSKGILIEDEDKQYSGFYFYEVNIEQELTSPSIEFATNNKPYSTTRGDIFIERESFLNLIPFSAEFITFYFGGHAGLISNQYKVIETSGMDIGEDNDVFIDSNKVFFEANEGSVIGLRVNATDDQINQAMDYAESLVGKPYNFSFILNRKNSYYCTDLISRTYSKESGLNFNLDKDGIATSCNDIVISDDTYMIYYFHYDKDGNKHLYYAVNK